MLFSSISAALGGVALAAAYPRSPRNFNTTDANPFEGKNHFANSLYAAKLEETIATFLAKNDTLNAARTRTVQGIGSFVWVTKIASLGHIEKTIKEARAEQERTKKEQIVQLVLYNLPDRDCSGGHSSGEFSSLKNGLELYKSTFVDPYAAAVKAAPDLTFAIILEPDSLGNIVKNQNLPFCAGAAPTHEEGIAYAISKLQDKNVHLYLDAANGAWFGNDDSLPKAAAELAKILAIAQKFTAGSTIRGFSTDIANFNPYIANPRANHTQGSGHIDELSYVQNLAPYLTNNSLPTKFIIDQSRSGLQYGRPSSEWCNVKAGFGIKPTTKTKSKLVDSIVWVKLGGESDGACGPKINGIGAPAAGSWWNDYAMELVKNANPPLKPRWAKAENPPLTPRAEHFRKAHLRQHKKPYGHY